MKGSGEHEWAWTDRCVADLWAVHMVQGRARVHGDEDGVDQVKKEDDHEFD